MRFEADRDVFSEAVSFAVKLLPQRTTLPILSGVLIEAKDNNLILSSFDYEVSSRTVIDVDVEETGSILVSGRLLAEIASRLPDTSVRVATTDSLITVDSGSARFTLLSMPREEYPTIPHVEKETGIVPAHDFAEAVAQVAVAASRDDVTPVITGVQLEFSDTALTLIATDRYRVAVRSIPWEARDVSHTVATALVPARTIHEIGKTFTTSGTVSLSLTNDGERELIAFTGGIKTVTSLLITGSFPPVQKLFPTNLDNYAVINTAELIEATRRVSLVIHKDAALRYVFTTEGLTLESVGSETAQASESIDAILQGPDTTVSLKPQFLIDGLAAVRSEFVRIAFTNVDNPDPDIPSKPGPVLITSQTSKEGPGTDSYKYLLQPNLLLR